MICRSAARVGRAEGPECESLGWNAVEAQETRPNKLSPPCKGRTNCDETTSRSIPCTSFVQWFAVLFAKSPVFGREIFLRMMLRLPADIFANHFDVRTTDAEFSVAGLPREISIPGILCFDPTRRGGFDLLDNPGRRVVLGLREQDMDVVANGIDFDER